MVGSIPQGSRKHRVTSGWRKFGSYEHTLRLNIREIHKDLNKQVGFPGMEHRKNS